MIRRAWEDLEFWLTVGAFALYLIPLLLVCRLLGIRLDD